MDNPQTRDPSKLSSRVRTRSTALAVVAHSALVGLLLGLATSPVVSVIAPILMGLGGYRLLDRVSATRVADASDRQRVVIGDSIARLAALWCLVATLTILASIAVRTGIWMPRPTIVGSLSATMGTDPGLFVGRRLLAKQLDTLELPADQAMILAREIDAIGTGSELRQLQTDATALAKDLATNDRRRFQMYSY